MISGRALRRAIAQAFRSAETRAAGRSAPAETRAALNAAEEAASRRGAATGHTQPAYRGQREPFDERVAADRAEKYDAAQWYSRRPPMAEGYASHEGGVMLPAQLRLGRTLELDAGGAPWNQIDARAIPDREITRRLRKRMRDSIQRSTLTSRDIAEAARELGYDSVTIRNMRTLMRGLEKDDVFAIVRPEKGHARARWARFDPGRANENNLLAGVTGAAAIPAGAASLDALRRRRRRVASAMEQA